MKKIIALILAAAMSFSLCACGGAEGDTEKAAENNTESKSSQSEIKLESPLLIAEDDAVKIELIGFREEKYDWVEQGSQIEKIIVFKLYNKSENELKHIMLDAYLNDERVHNMNTDQVNFGALPPGKSGQLSYLIQTEDKEALESMEQLYDLDGTFTLMFSTETGSGYNSVEVPFSVPAALNGDAVYTSPDELQGVWLNDSVDGFLMFNVYQDTDFNCIIMNLEGGNTNLSGSYSITEDKIIQDYDAEGFSDGYSNYSHDNGVLTIMSADGQEFKKLSAADIMVYLEQKEAESKHGDVICLADLIIDCYPDSEQYSLAIEKKEAVTENLLSNMTLLENRFDKTQTYFPKALPTDSEGLIKCYVRSFVLPYLEINSDGVCLNLMFNYFGDDWLFWEEVDILVDDEPYTETFRYNDIGRDTSGSDVFEYVIVELDSDSYFIDVLWDIANSSETLVRFTGQYHEDITISDSDKQAIRDVLTAYEALSD